MRTFTRLTSVIFFVLSLSMLTWAAPAPLMQGQKNERLHVLSTRGHQDGSGGAKVVFGAVVDLKASVVAQADVIGSIKDNDLTRAQIEVNGLIANVELCYTTIAELKDLNIDVKLKASIAGHVLVIIKAIIKICASLTAKFGIQAFLELFAKLDASLKVLLRSFDVCMDGFLVVLAKLLVDTDLKALVEIKLVVCHDLFVLVRAAIGIV
ncbi:hypothetical protein BN14_07481 [Rhizoctonia solani AG-1 IB]|uniref:Transmembrane protein n=1 Tax=Thanatephorus cucumeris (strain AG1-IB / isolate 7/3/14) TaxID=1108050 RepID=M5C1U3_THACB|nr:hypothetical protein BN14_07481 [Rhizoctonia solani AG-1 IB]